MRNGFYSHSNIRKQIWEIVAILIVILIPIALYIFLHKDSTPAPAIKSDDVYVSFDMEAYDTIHDNYWNKESDAEMATIYQLSLQKAANNPNIILSTTTRAGTEEMLIAEFKKLKIADEKKALATNLLKVVLFNLQPTNRNELQTIVEQKQLQNIVQNINPDKNLYDNLGLKSATNTEQIEKAYIQKKAVLEASTTPESRDQLKQLAYAHDVLVSPAAKKLYDDHKIEPTVFSHIIEPNTLYLYISSIAPTTINEFVQAILNASTTPRLTSLIIDFRNNIGGDLSFTQNAMSLFLGGNQYVFDFFHQGNYDPQRTPNFPPLPAISKYKEIAVLANSMTQSTAELTTSVLRRYNMAYIVGEKTRGWGSVERTFPINTIIDPNEKYAMLMVVNLTLGVNQQPIEVNGIVPDVDTSTKNWQANLPKYFNSSSLIKAIGKVSVMPPLK